MSGNEDSYAPFRWRESAGLQVRFCGNIRSGDDSGRHVFAVKSKDGIEYFGEFVARYPTPNTYDVEVLSLGYGNAGNVGNPHPLAMSVLKRSDVNQMRKAVVGLFRVPNHRPFPLDEDFTGRVHFMRNWVRLMPIRVADFTPGQLVLLLLTMLVIALCIGFALWWSTSYRVPSWLYPN